MRDKISWFHKVYKRWYDYTHTEIYVSWDWLKKLVCKEMENIDKREAKLIDKEKRLNALEEELNNKKYTIQDIERWEKKKERMIEPPLKKWRIFNWLK